MDNLAAQIEQAQAAQSHRRAAWLPYDVCCGRVVEHFNITHWVYLLEADNAFFAGRLPLGGDIAQMRWAIRKGSDWMSKPDKDFLRAVGKLDVAEAITEISDYIARAMYDVGTGGNESMSASIELAAFPAYFVDRFSERYGWSIDAIMKTPLARLGQLDRVARAAADDKSVYSSKLIALQAKQMAAG